MLSNGRSNDEEGTDCDGDDDEDDVAVVVVDVDDIWYFRNSHVDTDARRLRAIPHHPNIKMTAR